MKKSIFVKPALVAVCVMSALVSISAQEPLDSWPFFVEVTPPAGAQGLCDFIVTAEIFDRSHPDLADLRLYDATEREIPYALKVRRQGDEQALVEAREFNRARSGTTSELSVDLGESAEEHNEIEVNTEGMNFRRRVDVEASDDGRQWRVINSGAIIFRFANERGSAESNRITHPASRHRFLRVRVLADELADRSAPEITGANVLMTVREKEEMVGWDKSYSSPAAVRAGGEPGSAWLIDIGGRVLVDRLSLEVSDESFSRPFVVETADDPQNPVFVASGEISRRKGEPVKPVLIKFDEVHARRLRLIITDYRNPRLSIESIQAMAPARQVLFEMKNSISAPLRLYFGNHKASQPRYDIGKDLSIAPSPARCDLGQAVSNPGFVPEPAPLTERAPWLIYVALAASSLALGLILVSLARAAMRGRGVESEGA